MKKAKPMTAKEKRERAEARAWLREQGVLPPKKKPLNRARFCQEAKAVLEGESDFFVMGPYLWWGLYEVLGRREWPEGTVSLEAVGAAKAVLLAKRRMEFEEERRKNGALNYNIGELIEAVEDIYKA